MAPHRVQRDTVAGRSLAIPLAAQVYLHNGHGMAGRQDAQAQGNLPSRGGSDGRVLGRWSGIRRRIGAVDRVRSDPGAMADAVDHEVPGQDDEPGQRRAIHGQMVVRAVPDPDVDVLQQVLGIRPVRQDIKSCAEQLVGGRISEMDQCRAVTSGHSDQHLADVLVRGHRRSIVIPRDVRQQAFFRARRPVNRHQAMA